MIKLLIYMLKEGGLEKASIYLNWFICNMQIRDFKGIEQLMYCYLNHCYDLGVQPEKKYLKYYLDIRGKRDILRYSIPTEGEGTEFYDNTNIDTAFSILSQNLYAYYDEALTYSTEDDFKFVAEAYLSEIKKDRMMEMFTKYYPMIQGGNPEEEILEGMSIEIQDISSKYSSESIKEMDFMENAVGDEGGDKYRFICKTGLKCINGDIGGLYTKRITTVNGQPKGGKTRFALTTLIYPALISGVDVLFYETELPKDAIKNILIAYHIIQLYKGQIKIPDRNMNEEDGLSEDQQKYYEAAKYDLFSSGKYGRFIIENCDDIPVERLRANITNKIRADRNIKIVAIDYVGDLESDYELAHRKVKQQWEIITDAYKVAKKIVRPFDINMIMINQYNDEGEAAALKGQEITSGMCQGGRVVQRSTDYDLNLTFTEEQRVAGRRCISTGQAARGSAGFSRVPLKVEMSISVFEQDGE